MQPPDKRFLIVVLFLGIIAAGVSASWLSNGSITIRYGRSRGAPQAADRAVAGQITSDRLLFYPICSAWALLGGTMVTLAALAFFSGEPLFYKISAYCCAAVLLLAATTVAAALLAGPS